MLRRGLQTEKRIVCTEICRIVSRPLVIFQSGNVISLPESRRYVAGLESGFETLINPSAIIKLLYSYVIV